MGSIAKDVEVGVPTDQVWDAVRDFGALHERLVPGFVVGSDLQGSDRVITFASGATARERLVDLDEQRRRLVYTVVESQLGFHHHQSSVEIRPSSSGTGCTIVWTTDFLPEDPGPLVEGLMDAGAAAMRRAFGAGQP